MRAMKTTCEIELCIPVGRRLFSLDVGEFSGAYSYVRRRCGTPLFGPIDGRERSPVCSSCIVGGAELGKVYEAGYTDGGWVMAELSVHGLRSASRASRGRSEYDD